MEKYVPIVRFAEIFDKNVRFKKYQCFSCISTSLKIDCTVYKCPIDKSLSKNDVEIFLKIIYKIFPQNRFSHSLIKSNINKNGAVVYKLFSQNLTKEKKLVYLSVFRYLNEFPEIVKILSKCDDRMDNESIFAFFIKSHFELYNAKHLKYDNVLGHTLFGYDWNRVGSAHYPNYKFLSHKDFLANMENVGFNQFYPNLFFIKRY